MYLFTEDLEDKKEQPEDPVMAWMEPWMLRKFREGLFKDAAEPIQQAWKLMMLKFLPRICKDGWGTRQDKALLCNEKETTAAMEALVCWYVDMYGTLRWVPEHNEDKQRMADGGKKEKRGRRESEGEKERRKKGTETFAQYLKSVQERRGTSTDWDEALRDEAKKEREAKEGQPGVENDKNGTVSTGNKRKRVEKEPEPVIPTLYRFGTDGELEIVALADALQDYSEVGRTEVV